MKYFGNLSSIQSKSTQIDLVTNADTSSEKFILRELHSQFPTHNILTEESQTEIKQSEFCWVIDPLDGTTNFVHSLPIFAVSIGLQFNQETIVGVVYNPVYDKCFLAVKGGGAFLNDDPIHVSTTETMAESMLVTGFPYEHDEAWSESFELMRDLYGTCQGIRRLGAAALDFCYVAMGRFDGFYEIGLKPWDVCAGDLICREAGGSTTDWDGNPMPSSGRKIIASNGNIHTELMNAIQDTSYEHLKSY